MRVWLERRCREYTKEEWVCEEEGVNEKRVYVG